MAKFHQQQCEKYKHTNDPVINETIKALAINTVLLTKKLPKAELNIAAAQREKKDKYHQW